jgi:hypothetical protein
MYKSCKSMICRIFLFVGISEIYKNAHKVCGTFVALLEFLKKCRKI